MAKAKQTIRIRVNRNSNGNGTFKVCGACGGTGVVKGSNTKQTRNRR